MSFRIVLVGKTGVGKSATANTILGEKMFPSEARATSITKHCSSGKQMINDREEQNTVALIQQVFGTDANKHMIVLFTREDDLEYRMIEEYIHETPELNEVIKACEGRYHAFNNREKDRTQVHQLMKKIDGMMAHNQNSYYNYHLFQLANELNNLKKTVEEKDQISAELENEVKAQQRKGDSSSCTIL